MKTKIIQLFSLFAATDETQIHISEDWDFCQVEFRAVLDRTPAEKDLLTCIPSVNSRDSWQFLIKTEEDETLLAIMQGEGNLEQSYSPEKLALYQGDAELRYLFTINKHLIESVISVYDWESFLHSVKQLSCWNLFNAIANRLGGTLTIEIQEDGFVGFYTRTISIKGYREPSHSVIAIPNREQLLELRKNHCQWGVYAVNVLPDDFHYCGGEKNLLAEIFEKEEMLLLAMALCDSSSIVDNNIEVRLCGYKPLIKNIDISRLSEVVVSTFSLQLWYSIYVWCYSGGYVQDRLSIARNIISLNCKQDELMVLNASTFEAIMSNFKIFEQDNVRQYIKVRNEVSKLLIDMQREINSIVDGFASDFKKNIVALYSFFLTVVVVRVVAKGDYIGGFSNPVIALSFLFVGISIALLFYSRKELEKKERLFIKHYQQLKERYEPLLSKEELRRMFEDSDPNKLDSHANYIRWQKNVYTIMWAISIGIMSIILFGILLYNNFAKIHLCVLLKIIICVFIKSIFGLILFQCIR